MIRFSIEDIATPFAAVSREDVWQVIHDSNPEDLRRRLTRMRYSDFLRTPYWRCVAEKARSRDGGRCRVCDSDEKLNVHHRKYDHRGQEHLFLGDLTTLCQKCHKQHHGVADKAPAPKARFVQPAPSMGPGVYAARCYRRQTA